MSDVTGRPLPPGWTMASLSDVATVVMGQSPRSSTYNKSGDGLPFFQGKADFGMTYPRIRVWCVQPNKIAETDDILLSIRAPVGPTNLAPTQCCIGRDLAAIRPEAGLTLKFLLYAFRHFEDHLNARGTGTTFEAVSGKTVREFFFPIPPQIEQARIADTLDELFSDLNAGVAALERARDKLKLYRAAVLKAAVEGALTADWRESHPDVEPAGTLLKRILVERRRRWEQDQLRKFEEKGKTPPKNWKAKYKEPVAPDTTSLPPLPAGWCWASLNQITEIVGGVTKGQKISDQNPTREVPYLRVANVQRGYLDLAEIKRIRARESEIDMLLLKPGDILFTEGGDRDKLGRGWVWSGEIDECVHQNHVFRARPISPLLQSEIISWSGNSYGQAWFLKAGKQSVNLASINLTVLRSFPVPLPPSAEQETIVAAVQAQLSVVEQLEAGIDAKLQSAQALRQSILKHAFTGKLGPQDPDDEPASELLQRIAAERKARVQEAAAAKRRRLASRRSRK